MGDVRVTVVGGRVDSELAPGSLGGIEEEEADDLKWAEWDEVFVEAKGTDFPGRMR